jgi:hypothetical protein
MANWPSVSCCADFLRFFFRFSFGHFFTGSGMSGMISESSRVDDIHVILCRPYSDLQRISIPDLVCDRDPLTKIPRQNKIVKM